jgi:calcineurin-like phosphoesterase family protein
MQETHPIVITSMNAIHVLEGDRVFRQLNITILELAKRVVCRALITLFVDKYGGRQLLWFLRGHDKNHRAKDNGQCHRQQYISIVYHHGAKVHFFHYSQKSAFRATETSRSRVKHATIVLCSVGLRNRPAGAGGLWFALSAYLFLALHGILTLIPAR